MKKKNKVNGHTISSRIPLISHKIYYATKNSKNTFKVTAVK